MSQDLDSPNNTACNMALRKDRTTGVDLRFFHDDWVV